MIRSIYKTIKQPSICKQFLFIENVNYQSTRSTYVLKRRHPAPLYKEGFPLKALRPKYYIYDVINDTKKTQTPELTLILTDYVKGLGIPGEKVTVNHDYGYNALLLPGLAVYASTGNIQKFKDYKIDESKRAYSSPQAPITADRLEYMLLAVVMNMENPWILQRWHIKASFRKCGYIVPEDAITLPSEPIQGPDLDLENREFYVVVTINNFEKVKVRCCIHHWSTNVTNRLEHVHEYWKSSAGFIFPEDESVLASMPKRHERVKIKTKYPMIRL